MHPAHYESLAVYYTCRDFSPLPNTRFDSFPLRGRDYHKIKRRNPTKIYVKILPVLLKLKLSIYVHTISVVLCFKINNAMITQFVSPQVSNRDLFSMRVQINLAPPTRQRRTFGTSWAYLFLPLLLLLLLLCKQVFVYRTCTLR